MTRDKVYELIDGEREYQDNCVATDVSRSIDADKHSVGDFLTMLDVYVRLAQEAWTNNPGDEAALDIIRKCAGIVVNCMEHHDASPRSCGVSSNLKKGKDKDWIKELAQYISSVTELSEEWLETNIRRFAKGE